MHIFLRCITSMISSAGILTIDLGAIQSNWRYVTSTLKNAECAAVVKADAYGVGVSEVAPALYSAGCKSFYVATLEEAADLRLLLPNAELYVLGGVRDGAEPEFLKLNLMPVLFTLNNIYCWLRFCASVRKALPCAIKLDTGMSRLGLSDNELNELIDSAREQLWLNPVLLMSHLACADEPSHSLNCLQLTRFHTAIEKTKVFFPRIKTSIANSSGAFLGEHYHLDMVRIGAALYGINPQPLKPNPLKQVIDLKLPVLQLRTTQAAVCVGYGGEGKAENSVRLAVVAGGYADGLHRTLGSIPQGIVDGAYVSAIGRISMDSMVFDISMASSNPEYVQVINDKLTINDLIEKNKSLGYEVLTSLGRRYSRRYI